MPGLTMNESRKHMHDEEVIFDASADDQADAGFDDPNFALDSLIAKLDEIAQGSPSLLSPEDIEAFDSLSDYAALEELLPPLTGFDSLVVEIDGVTGEATANIKAIANTEEAALQMPPDEANTQHFDLLPLLSGIQFEPEGDTMPVFDLQDEVEMPDGQSFAASENWNEACGILDSLVAEIDREAAQGASEVGAPAEASFSSASKDAADNGAEQHVIFTLDGTAYSFPITSVTEIGRPLAVTPLPNVPDWVSGVANLRGDIVSVVDLRRFLGMGANDAPRDNRMLIVRSRNEEIQTALVVDAVHGIRFFDGGRVTQPTASVTNSVTPYMRGVYEHDKGLVVLLDPERLMSSDEMRQFEVASNR